MNKGWISLRDAFIDASLPTVRAPQTGIRYDIATDEQAADKALTVVMNWMKVNDIQFMVPADCDDDSDIDWYDDAPVDEIIRVWNEYKARGEVFLTEEPPHVIPLPGGGERSVLISTYQIAKPTQE